MDDALLLAPLLQGFADAGMRDQPAADLLCDNNTAFEPARTPADWLSRDPDEVGVQVGLTLYEGARHELLNETNRDHVTADVISWIQARR